MKEGLIMDLELCGFAENEKVIDGTYDEYLAFNHCLSSDYVSAIYGEDFEALGDLSSDLLDDILYWIPIYDQKDEETKENIESGLFKTYKNRTFIDAILANNNTEAAYTYLKRNGISYNDKYIDLLILLIINYGENGHDLINNIIFESLNKKEIEKKLRIILKKIINIYDQAAKVDDIDIQEKIRSYINDIKYPKKLGKLYIDKDIVNEICLKINKKN